MALDFDPEKSAADLVKHGIDFEAAKALWADDRRISVRSDFPGEERWIVIGTIGDRLWAAAVTSRDNAVRIISVRRARRKEEVLYGSQDD
ncbi:MAG: uncharacterized protein QOI38_2553 [Sphingomonadales bacterium]|jgi:uncharacterized DUF497 family protein|nr:uncharacterized protein [Sphingomonadales bacterium]